MNKHSISTLSPTLSVQPTRKGEHQIGAPYFVLSRNLAFKFCNEFYLQLIEKPESDVVGHPFVSVHPNAKGSEIFLALGKIDSRSQLKVSDYSIHLRGWFDYHITSSDDEVSVLVIDTTAHMNSEINLESLAERARSSIESCIIGIAQISLDGHLVDINKRGLEIIGQTGFDISSLSLEGISINQYRKTDALALAEIIEGRRDHLASERQFLRKDGGRIWVEMKIAAVRSPQGNVQSFVMTFSDIAERKGAEESLQFALEASQMGDWNFDAINNVTKRSKRFDEIFGYQVPLKTWGYEDFLRHIHPADRAQVSDKFEAALSEGKNCAAECRIVWPDGSIHWISLRGRVYLNDMGRTVQMAGLISDITEERVASEKIEKARLAAEDANREKSYFLANMSHEIRTPLGAILGFTDILADSSVSQADRLRYLQIIKRNGEGLSKLIDEILDLSKVEAGYLEIENAVMNVTELVEEVTSLLKVKADVKQLKLQIQSEGEIPRLLIGDPIRVRQILMNIIGNAIKFTTEGSVSVCLKFSEGRLHFFVKDTGAGISEEARDRLFQPFTQADNSTSRQFGGTGLGLALSRRLAIAMGGNLELRESEPGRGSTFVVTIKAVVPKPSVRAQEAVMSASAAATSPLVAPSTSLPEQMHKLSGLKILLAEDSPDNQILIKRLLDKKGVETEFACDGEIALEKAMHDHYDIVLMDMQMPRLDGYEATRMLREQGYKAPIIALTAHAMRHDRTKCISAGCDEYLSKPIEPSQLYRILAAMAEQIKH